MDPSILLIIPGALILGLIWRPDIVLQIMGLLVIALAPYGDYVSLNEPVPSFAEGIPPRSPLLSMIGMPSWIGFTIGMLLIAFGRGIFQLRRIARSMAIAKSA